MELNAFFSFGAGLLSFFAPCVLPLVPSYLISITGTSNATQKNEPREGMITHAVAFVFGFSMVFVALGISSSLIGHFLFTYQPYISRVGGIFLIIMGLFSLNIIRIPFLDRHRTVYLKETPIGLFGSLILGVTFSLGWTPCIGPVLSSILVIASAEGSVMRGALLLSMYSLGLAIPFIVSALLFKKLLRFLKRFGSVARYSSKIMGVLLILIGILLATSYLNRISQWLEVIF